MRVERVGELEGLLPWTPAGASSWSCSFVIIIIIKKEAKEPFECERTSEKRERQKGEKSPGI